MTLPSIPVDKAGKQYWDTSWEEAGLAQAVDPRRAGLRNYVERRYHRCFAGLFTAAQTRGMRLLEVGCANSAWLPYFAQEFHFKVAGLDYSEIGCEQERRVLRGAGVDGEVLCGNLFSPPAAFLSAFDVVVSFGLVEHFSDTREVVAALGTMLKPGGMLFTMVPNLAGSLGSIQRVLNRPVYDIHVPLDREALAEAHRGAGYAVQSCEYFIATSFGVCNLNGVPARSAAGVLKKAALAVLARLSTLEWMLEGLTGPWPVSRSFSPYINCVARKDSR